MVITWPEPKAQAPWQDAHFIGGHPALDLANTVFDRANPAPDNDLLKAPADLLAWCESVGLFEAAPSLRGPAAELLLEQTRSVREATWVVFDAVSRGQAVPGASLAGLLELSGACARAGRVPSVEARLDDLAADWAAPGAIPAGLSLLAVQALFTLPPERVRVCDRCGWLFLDSSRGRRRRWCSMSTCGNREKASRHRRAAKPATNGRTSATNSRL